MHLDIDIPERGRKHWFYFPQEFVYHLDIDIPERGRKLYNYFLLRIFLTFRYRYPREGTETMDDIHLLKQVVMI